MPTYVYGCDACGHQFEKFQKISDEPIRTCPNCAKNVRRIFQPAGIVFKGSGWHINDYKRSGSQASNGSGDNKTSGNSDNKASSDGDTQSSSGNSDSAKPETKSESVAKPASDAA